MVNFAPPPLFQAHKITRFECMIMVENICMYCVICVFFWGHYTPGRKFTQFYTYISKLAIFIWDNFSEPYFRQRLNEPRFSKRAIISKRAIFSERAIISKRAKFFKKSQVFQKEPSFSNSQKCPNLGFL